jgi:hypothetical protein
MVNKIRQISLILDLDCQILCPYTKVSMNQPLFINTNPEFIKRIRIEAGESALVTPSMIQALRWITDADIPISGIYLNPNDTNYSALRFIEISLLQRPATPVFLIDAENHFSEEAQKLLFESNHIKGVFPEHKSYLDLVRPLNLQPTGALENLRKRATQRSEHAGYVAVPIIDFANSSHYPFDVFVEDGKELRLFATGGDSVEPEYFSHVIEKTAWLFVSEKTIQQTRESLRHTQSSFMDLSAFPISWKTAEVLFNAKVLLNEMRKSGLSDTLVEHTHFMLSDVFHLVSEITQASKLSQFIEQAKNCDKTIACTTLSILMCRSLKFEKNAIVEILGLASLFQDISLFNSPYGNLYELEPTELSPEAYAYFLRHPTTSADLVAQNTSVPDVTLQVMRQHHERKDRTGFPNRIGGMQLHPMAEVLSLINGYLDYQGDEANLEQELFSHYSDRMVGAFKNLLGILSAQKLRVAA